MQSIRVSALAASVALLTGVVAAQHDAPPRRAHHTLVYDGATSRVLLIGGSTPTAGGQSYTFFDDLWAFDGKRWIASGSTGSPRSGQAVAYDSKRRRVLSFGGYCSCRAENDGRFSDLLELKEGRWESIGTIPERPTTDAGLVYDIRRDRLVLFGGAGVRRQMLGDTWEYDGTTWTKVAATGPDARSGFAMVYDEARGRTVLFSGFSANPGSPSGETWIYDGSAWTRAATDGPSPRHSAGMAYDSKRHLVVLFGGSGPQDLLQDTWTWNGQSWTQVSNEGPGARMMGALAYDARRDRTVMFGPYGPKNELSDTWEWDGRAWRRVE